MTLITFKDADYPAHPCSRVIAIYISYTLCMKLRKRTAKIQEKRFHLRLFLASVGRIHPAGG